ncbi:hypothetical protein AB0R01_30750 [Streptomyces rochei]|uniref:hypothetical protein n=1 Tax=Streptomyces rochei TaxID=1928 RepID=UPI00344380D8
MIDAFLTVIYGATAWIALTTGLLAGLTVAAGAAIRAGIRRHRNRQANPADGRIRAMRMTLWRKGEEGDF